MVQEDKNEIQEEQVEAAEVQEAEAVEPEKAETKEAEDKMPEKAEAKKVEGKKPWKKDDRERRPRKVFETPKDADGNEIIEKVIKIGRVSKVVKGGKNFSFNAVVVSGNGKGSVGFGFGKSNEVADAIRKGSAAAKKSFHKVKMQGDTIPHETIGRFKATKVMLKPAGPGTGVIAGGAVRAMCDAAGIKNILTKCIGSRNSFNIIRATMNGFEGLRLKRRG